MAQAALHGMAGLVVRKWSPRAEWLMLGIVLGNLFPDTDNLAVAVATLAGRPTEGLHRTFTHSLFTSAAILAIFYLIAALTRSKRWGLLGIGLGIGVLMHILLDLLIWFNGVEILWPIPSWVNLWAGYQPPAWFDSWMLVLEFPLLALFFSLLASWSKKQGTDVEYLKALRAWVIVQLVFFVALSILVFVMASGFMTIAGALYLFSLGTAIGVTIRMRRTVDFIPR